MTRADKLLQKLCKDPPPKDFTWDELCTLMRRHGFVLETGSGSKRQFFHTTTDTTVSMHEPHPHNTLKKYQIDLAVNGLKAIGVLS